MEYTSYLKGFTVGDDSLALAESQNQLPRNSVISKLED
jgi:hypothetical protein